MAVCRLFTIPLNWWFFFNIINLVFIFLIPPILLSSSLALFLWFSMVLHFFDFLFALPPNGRSFFDFHLLFFSFWTIFSSVTLYKVGGFYFFWKFLPNSIITQNQGGQLHFLRMHLPVKSSIWHCSFPISSNL